MIEFTFKMTIAGNEPRDFVVRIHSPIRSPPERSQPWTVIVDVDGRPHHIRGNDPIDAIEWGARFAAGYLHGMEGLDPAVDPPHPYADEATSPVEPERSDPAKSD